MQLYAHTSPNLTAPDHNYVIRSTDTVGKVSKTVLVDIIEANDGVFNKYAMYSSGEFIHMGWLTGSGYN
jgi:hypothetical protein